MDYAIEITPHSYNVEHADAPASYPHTIEHAHHVILDIPHETPATVSGCLSARLGLELQALCELISLCMYLGEVSRPG